MSASQFPALLQGFFADRLQRQVHASPHTSAGYRDCFRLLLRYAARRLRKEPSDIVVQDIDASFVIDFLEFLEKERENTARTRNIRLAAMRSFFRYVSMNEPAYALHCQRILAIPRKRYEKKMIEFLTEKEIKALVAAPDRSSWRGRRDRTILLVLAQTGLRVSELTGLRRRDIVLGRSAHIWCEGKGRKYRPTPLRRDVESALKAWVEEQRLAPDAFVFPSSAGGRLSTDAAERLVTKHLITARNTCPSLVEKNVTPHVLRHSTAMSLLKRGVDRSVIALWLGHESVETTQMYLHADLKMKERALARAAPIKGKTGRYRPGDALMAYLDNL